jgi:phosphoribosylformimino-5-aminoimidazole carboxamide ribotide isomerase
VVPAIDVLDGRVVRLRAGRREAVTIEGGDPVELARRFADEGAHRLHVVDLDGAFSGTPSRGLVAALAGIGLPVQVGGGYRSASAIAEAMNAGADRVMVGTAALSPGFLADALAMASPDRLVVAIDVADGRVVVEGWTAITPVTPAALARRCAESGVRRLLVTSTVRDGSLAGPDTSLLASVTPVGLPVLAAGGIASLDDLVTLRSLGCEGAVVGSALLAGRFTLGQALARVTG